MESAQPLGGQEPPKNKPIEPQILGPEPPRSRGIPRREIGFWDRLRDAGGQLTNKSFWKDLGWSLVRQAVNAAGRAVFRSVGETLAATAEKVFRLPEAEEQRRFLEEQRKSEQTQAQTPASNVFSRPSYQTSPTVRPGPYTPAPEHRPMKYPPSGNDGGFPGF
jgi:hypothetical protein